MHYIDGIARCELDRQELSLGDMARTICEKLGRVEYEQRVEKEAREGTEK